MIEQVRLAEIAMLPGITTPIERTVFAFGTHPQATDDEQHPVTTAKAIGNKLRIIMDELLRGNNLEEIKCRGFVDTDEYSPVPVGATPDDVARCATAQDVLPRTCPASNRLSMCICQNDGGCSAVSGTTMVLVQKGDPVGIEDRNGDGAADKTRFIAGAVGLSCGGATVAIDQTTSYWTPSGNQERPAQGGFDALGPAIVLVPLGALPTGSQCGLQFSPDVVDKDGNQVCAPPDGEINAGCTAGDTSAFKFSTELLKFSNASGAATPQSLTADVLILANGGLDATSLANITVTEGPSTPYTQFTTTLSNGGAGSVLKQIAIHWTVGLTPSTDYTITVPTTVTDSYRKSAPQPFQIAFTTAAN